LTGLFLGEKKQLSLGDRFVYYSEICQTCQWEGRSRPISSGETVVDPQEKNTTAAVLTEVNMPPRNANVGSRRMFQ